MNTVAFTADTTTLTLDSASGGRMFRTLAEQLLNFTAQEMPQTIAQKYTIVTGGDPRLDEMHVAADLIMKYVASMLAADRTSFYWSPADEVLPRSLSAWAAWWQLYISDVEPEYARQLRERCPDYTAYNVKFIARSLREQA